MMPARGPARANRMQELRAQRQLRITQLRRLRASLEDSLARHEEFLAASKRMEERHVQLITCSDSAVVSPPIDWAKVLVIVGGGITLLSALVALLR